MLTSCAFQLFFGRIYTFYSTKWVFLSAIILFEIGSALCGAAPTSVAFIIGRSIAGIGCAGVFSGVIIIMTQTIPLAKRGAWQGGFGAVFGIASIVGPLLGGKSCHEVKRFHYSNQSHQELLLPTYLGDGVRPAVCHLPFLTNTIRLLYQSPNWSYHIRGHRSYPSCARP